MMRYLFVCALLILASNAFAEGEYQRTRTGKIMVWNNDPKPGDEATWSGGHDGDGYAAGFGTLTWHTGEKQTVKRLGILPVTKSAVYARYFGNMVHGKFNGLVNAHTNGKTANAVFIDGVRSSSWAAGRAPSRKMPQPRVEVAQQETTAEPTSSKRTGVVNPAAPAEGPNRKSKDRSERTKIGSQKAEVSAQSSERANRTVPKPATNKKSQTEVDESLSELVGPPPSLHVNPDGDASPADAKQDTAALSSIGPRLTKEAVVDLAEAGARKRGYNPAEYERTGPQYNSADQIWTINYQQKLFDETMEGGKRFSVTVDDKTKGTVFVLGK